MQKYIKLDKRYTEPTYYDDPYYGIAGKSLDMYHMKFAGYHK